MNGKVVGAGIAAVVALGAGLGVAAVGGGGEKGDDSKDRAASTTAPAPAVTTTTAPAEDALCVAYESFAAVVAEIGAVEGPAELERYMTAQVEFHGTAAEVAGEPDAAAFRSAGAYWEAASAFFSGRGWQQQVAPSDAGLVPQPPTDGSIARSQQALAERCGVTPVVETPG